jgi:CheY-like chemotaxis protein
VRVLFVEDDTDALRDFWEAILEEHDDWILEHVASVQKAWAYLSKSDVDAIVIDVMLPPVPGVEEKTEGCFLVACLRDREVARKYGLLEEVKEGNKRAPVAIRSARVTDNVRRKLDDFGIPSAEWNPQRASKRKGGGKGKVRSDADWLSIIAIIPKAEKGTRVVMQWLTQFDGGRDTSDQGYSDE